MQLVTVDDVLAMMGDTSKLGEKSELEKLVMAVGRVFTLNDDDYPYLSYPTGYSGDVNKVIYIQFFLTARLTSRGARYTYFTCRIGLLAVGERTSVLCPWDFTCKSKSFTAIAISVQSDGEYHVLATLAVFFVILLSPCPAVNRARGENHATFQIYGHDHVYVKVLIHNSQIEYSDE